MYSFKSKKKSMTVWDAANNKPLCRFVDGIFETEDATQAQKLVNMGYGMEGGEMALTDLSREQVVNGRAEQEKPASEAEKEAEQEKPAKSKKKAKANENG